jgi:hypothetical protein
MSVTQSPTLGSKITRQYRSTPTVPNSESAAAPVGSVEPIVVESCHSTWIFDPSRRRFCRILKGIKAAGRSVNTAWQPYWQLDLDPFAEDFTVYVTPSRNRLIRSWRHGQDCRQCGSSDMAGDVPADVVRSLFDANRGEIRPGDVVR